VGDDFEDLQHMRDHDQLSSRPQDCTSRASTGRIGIRHAQA
jgi:hypothetical protein